jgi:hypothetical protein
MKKTMEKVTPIPEAHFDKAFEAAVGVLAAVVPEAGKGKGKGQSPAKPGDVYPPEPNKPRKPPTEPNKPRKAHVSHPLARVAIGHAARAFHQHPGAAHQVS